MAAAFAGKMFSTEKEFCVKYHDFTEAFTIFLWISVQKKKKRTETVLVWSVSEICFSHQQNVNVKGSTFLLTTPSLLSLVLEGMKPHEILFYSLICEWDYLMN